MLRALWESAIVSYGRMGASDKRKVDFRTFVREIGGSAAEQLHEELMLWRHEHVAHRTGAQFEDSVVEVFFDDQDVNHLNIMVSTAIGPDGDGDLTRRFLEHIDKLRDHLWEKYMAPWGTILAERTTRPVTLAESAANTEPRDDRIGLNLTLWDRVNAAGSAMTKN
ncbi:hypothetical protein OS122_09310 [Mycolicibacterium mucogenicum]|uniref:hypothetical protein n=1 Tax=Mycolicibacterium TaxID=1866885 RepID=UPI00226AD4F4|nr:MULTISPECIES: hypothetical protein [Mycolicibacterium]MCX8561080.1 hypothetical protein [Mycolicibacterium mucogenicum]